MSRSVNRVILVGNVGGDPDVRQTANGVTVAHLSMATSRVFQRNGNRQRKTDWHRLTFWAHSAEAVERHVRKGTRLYVEGRLEYGSYQREGVTIPTADVVVQDFVFLDPRVVSGGAAAEADPDDEMDERVGTPA